MFKRLLTALSLFALVSVGLAGIASAQTGVPYSDSHSNTDDNNYTNDTLNEGCYWYEYQRGESPEPDNPNVTGEFRCDLYARVKPSLPNVDPAIPNDAEFVGCHVTGFADGDYITCEYVDSEYTDQQGQHWGTRYTDSYPIDDPPPLPRRCPPGWTDTSVGLMRFCNHGDYGSVSLTQAWILS